MSGASTYWLGAGEMRAEFWPGAGMLGASLKYRGVELLRRVEDLEAARVKGSTAGIPLLYPWANRLSGSQYRAAGREVSLDSSSTLLHFDDHRLPMHGVPWGQLRWEVILSDADTLTARLDWVSEKLLAIFPFPHHVEMVVRVGPGDLEIATTVFAIRVRRFRSVLGFIRISGFLESRGESGNWTRLQCASSLSMRKEFLRARRLRRWRSLRHLGIRDMTMGSPCRVSGQRFRLRATGTQSASCSRAGSSSRRFLRRRIKSSLRLSR